MFWTKAPTHLLHASRAVCRHGVTDAARDDPGDSVLSLSPSIRSLLDKRNDWSELCLMIADAIRLHVIALTPEQAEDAAENVVERLEEGGYEIRRL